MKTMRNALLAVGVLTAMIGTVKAQTVSPTSPEILFSGALQGSGGATGSSFNNLTGFGFITGGALFALPLFDSTISPTASEANAFYSFTLTGLTLASQTQMGSDVNATYTGGTLNIYFDSTPDQSFSNTASFSDGLLFLQGTNVTINSIFDLGEGTGSFGGAYVASGGTILPLLGPNTLGSITGNTSAVVGVPAGFQFSTDGRSDLIPEPTTMALLGVGLLPLAAFVRRRRA